MRTVGSLPEKQSRLASIEVTQPVGAGVVFSVGLGVGLAVGAGDGAAVTTTTASDG